MGGAVEARDAAFGVGGDDGVSDAVQRRLQVGLRRFIQAYSADYHLIMAASLCSLIPVSVVFLSLQKYFIEGIATTGLKG